MLLPLQGALHRFIIPRAMPWAMRLLPLRGALHRFIIPRAMLWAMCSLPLRGVPSSLHHTQGDALGYMLVAPSGRASSPALAYEGAYGIIEIVCSH